MPRFVWLLIRLPLMLLKGMVTGLITALNKLQRPRNPIIELVVRMDYTEPEARATAGGGIGTAAISWRTPAGRAGDMSDVRALRALSVAALYAKVLSIDSTNRKRLFETVGGAVRAAGHDPPDPSAFGFAKWELKLSDPAIGEVRLPVWPWRLLAPGSKVEADEGPTLRTYVLILGEDQRGVVSFLDYQPGFDAPLIPAAPLIAIASVMQFDDEAAEPLQRLLERINAHYGTPDRITNRSDFEALRVAMA